MTPKSVQHPYQDLPESAFWKSSVADKEPLKIENLWSPKFTISQESKIITAGSCFAQHISRALVERDFTWIDSEPGPSHIPKDLHRSNGYGIFSFRTGNIYTAALLRQWIYWSIGISNPPNEVYREKDKFFDPFRPAINEQGFCSENDLFDARNLTFKAIKDVLQEADIFIFTLGLTEAWCHKKGYVYPVCPGTLHGKFDNQMHFFKNFNYQEVLKDLSKVIKAIKKINRSIKILLTVSPVPLTATTSNKHVLIATSYSKSVLRSVAGELADSNDCIDYFPSYEIITSFPFRGMFFEKNLRSVSKEGVNFVMDIFFSSISNFIGKSNIVTKELKIGISNTESFLSNQKMYFDDIICEDEMLEFWNKNDNKVDKSIALSNIFLIGDSHVGRIGKILDDMEIPYYGGPIMWGSQWHNLNFDEDSENIFMPHDLEIKKRWQSIISSLDASNLKIIPVPIITNIGNHTHMLIFSLIPYLRNLYGNKTTFEINDKIVEEFLEIARAPHFRILKMMATRAPKVIWFTDPPCQPENGDLYSIVDKIMSEKVKNLGCQVFNSRDLFLENGVFPSKFKSSEIIEKDIFDRTTDWIHGSDLFYRELLNKIIEEQN